MNWEWVYRPEIVAAVVGGILGFCGSLLLDRRAARRAITSFLIEKRQLLDSDAELLNVIRLLKQERDSKGGNGSPPVGPKNDDEGQRWRRLPAFLEPIGTYLHYTLAIFRNAYGVFSEEVLLCAESRLLWPPNQRYDESVYWRPFCRFVKATKEAGYNLNDIANNG
jgi:hypothetical protein